MQARLPGEAQSNTWSLSASQRSVHGLDLMLLPAGHIFGSAQLFLETDQGSLLYTGDFKLRPGRSAEQAEWRQAETLIMETTYGLPRYRLPPTDEVIDSNHCLLPGHTRFRRRPDPARLFVRKGAGNSLLTGRRRAQADAARVGLFHDADL